TVLDCGACDHGRRVLRCEASSMNGCRCVCAAGGHGDTCLPAAVPDGLGPLPLPDARDTEVRCVHGGSISSVDDPDPGVRGLCFVNVTFTAAIVLDLWSFDAPQQTLNITLLQCVLMDLSIKGSGARVHVSVTSSVLDWGALEFEGNFGASSQILVVGSTLVSKWSHAIAFLDFALGANSTLLLLDNRIEGNRYAVYFANAAVVDGGGIIVRGNTLRTMDVAYNWDSALHFHSVDLKNGGYFDVENNTMSAANGVYFFGDTTVSSAGLLRVADCTFVGDAGMFDPTLVYLDGSVTLQGGAQWRVTGNNVSAASILSISGPWHKIQLSDSGTAVALAHNRQVEGSAFFSGQALSNTVVSSPAHFVVGCNLKDGREGVVRRRVSGGRGAVWVRYMQRRRGVLHARDGVGGPQLVLVQLQGRMAWRVVSSLRGA
ncbi:putative dispersed gene family protein 1 (DGF-1), partial [Trypanosoma cruzi]